MDIFAMTAADVAVLQRALDLLKRLRPDLVAAARANSPQLRRPQSMVEGTLNGALAQGSSTNFTPKYQDANDDWTSDTITYENDITVEWPTGVGPTTSVPDGTDGLAVNISGKWRFISRYSCD